MLAVLRQRVSHLWLANRRLCPNMGVYQSDNLHRTSIVLLYLFFLVSQFFKPRVFDSLACCDSTVGVVDKKFLYKIYSFRAHVRDQLRYSCSLCHGGEIEFHVSRIFLKLL